jgi:ornithine cyclodeaminase
LKQLMSADDITPIGDVINGSHLGRSSDTEITMFDGTGVGLQDLAVASVAARLAEEGGKAQQIQL